MNCGQALRRFVSFQALMFSVPALLIPWAPYSSARILGLHVPTPFGHAEAAMLAGRVAAKNRPFRGPGGP